MRRLFLLLLVIAGIAPGTWWRSRLPAVDERPILIVESIRVPRKDLGEGIEVAGAWHLSSPNAHFSGYSALLPMDDGTLLAVSDRWRRMRFAPLGSARRSADFGFFSMPTQTRTSGWDLEGVTRDPASGRVWGTYERRNYIERYDADFLVTGGDHPPEMQRWPNNGGAEGIVRLADGRFIVLSEGSPRWFDDDLPALLFPGDPVEGAKPAPFRFDPPAGFSPVDMAQLPDGRVLILLRAMRLGLPPHFEGKLVVAHPAEITPGEPWPWQEIAHLAEPVPMDNYEGLAVEPAEDGRIVLWLISDDNRSMFQRTLLLKLLWRPNEKVRGRPRAPR